MATKSPAWVKRARKSGIPAYPSSFGWILDLNAYPKKSAVFLSKEAKSVFPLMIEDDFALLKVLRELREEIEKASGTPILPMLERENPNAVDAQTGARDGLRNVAKRFAEANKDNEWGLSAKDMRSFVASQAGDIRGRAESSNSSFQSTVFFAPDNRRQYIVFADAGPQIFFDSKENGAVLTKEGFDETDIEMFEFGLEIILLLISIVGVCVGAGTLGKGADITKKEFREFVKTLLKNKNIKTAMAVLFSALLGADAERIRKGDPEAIRALMEKFMDLLKSIWDEGMIKSLLVQLGVAAAILAVIVGILWWFGVGEILSLILFVVGVGGIIYDLLQLICKVQDWKKRKSSAPVPPK